MTTTVRLLVTDAVIGLKRSGFMVEEVGSASYPPHYLYAFSYRAMEEKRIRITSGTVDNTEVERLLKAVK